MKKQLTTRRILQISLILGVVLTLTIIGLFSINTQKPYKSLGIRISITNPLYHMAGGFGIDSTGKIIDAASNGLSVALYYATPPTADSPLGKQLLASHMKIIDGFISGTIYYYECHKSKIYPHPTHAIATYCSHDYYPSYTSDNVVVSVIKAHIQSVMSNPLIAGYWVLDDQAIWDVPGYAKNILNQTNALIQQYTPTYPTICGFGASLGLNKGYGWLRSLALNFTAQGCDMVGLYIYSSSQPVNKPPVNTNTFDWTMSSLLPAMFNSLRAQGWDSSKEPLIGIPQAWAGIRKDIPSLYEPTPSALNMQTQAYSFCQQGAASLIYYGWDDSSVTQFPWNNPGMKLGVQQGVTACKSYWAGNQSGLHLKPRVSPKPKPRPTPKPRLSHRRIVHKITPRH